MNYKIFQDKNLIGKSTNKNELIGVVQAGGFSSKYGFWKKLKEETQIRLDNKQNIIFILIIFLTTLLLGFITFFTFLDKSFLNLSQQNLKYLLYINIFFLLFFIFIKILN